MKIPIESGNSDNKPEEQRAPQDIPLPTHPWDEASDPDRLPPEVAQAMRDVRIWSDDVEKLARRHQAEESKAEATWQRRVDKATNINPQGLPNQQGFITLIVGLILVVLAVIALVFWRVVSTS